MDLPVSAVFPLALKEFDNKSVYVYQSVGNIMNQAHDPWDFQGMKRMQFLLLLLLAL